MRQNIFVLLLLSFFSISFVHAQEVTIVSNDQSYIAYSLKDGNITFTVEDLQSETSGSNEYASEADFKETAEMDYCIIEIDRNNNQNVDKADIGFKLTGLENKTYFDRDGKRYNSLGHCAYTMYEGFPGEFMNNISRGCDNNKKTKAICKGQWQTGEQGSNEHPVWTLTLPLKEVVLSNAFGLRVMIYRKYSLTTFSYPKVLDGNTFVSYTISPKNYDAAGVKKTEMEQQKAALMTFSRKQYRSTVEYDGVYIDMGNGRFAQLVAMQAANGRIVATAGRQHTQSFAFTPFVAGNSTSVAVSAVRKIVCVGGKFTDEFMNQLRISKVENINDLDLTWQNDSRNDEIKVLAVAGEFGSSVSYRSEQPANMYTPLINKQTYEDFITLPYNKKSISASKKELYPKTALTKGLYALWNNSTFWLFTVQ
jgi:hypothetical protein